MENFKKLSIEIALRCYDKIFIHVIPIEDVVIGKRGFIGGEVTNGIVLSISSTATRGLEFFDEGMKMMLRFSGKWEDVFVPYSAIDAILDDLQSPTFVYNFPAISINKVVTDLIKNDINMAKKADSKPARKTKTKKEKILKIDFTGD